MFRWSLAWLRYFNITVQTGLQSMWISRVAIFKQEFQIQHAKYWSWSTSCSKEPILIVSMANSNVDLVCVYSAHGYIGILSCFYLFTMKSMQTLLWMCSSYRGWIKNLCIFFKFCFDKNSPMFQLGISDPRSLEHFFKFMTLTILQRHKLN